MFLSQYTIFRIHGGAYTSTCRKGRLRELCLPQAAAHGLSVCRCKAATRHSYFDKRVIMTAPQRRAAGPLHRRCVSAIFLAQMDCNKQYATRADAEAPRGTSVLAYAPLFPHPREEKWNFVVADAANNTVYTRQEVSLIEAEAVGISHPVSLHQRAAILMEWSIQLTHCL